MPLTNGGYLYQPGVDKFSQLMNNNKVYNGSGLQLKTFDLNKDSVNLAFNGEGYDAYGNSLLGPYDYLNYKGQDISPYKGYQLYDSYGFQPWVWPLTTYPPVAGPP